MKKRGGKGAWMQRKGWISIHDIHIVLIHANLNQLQKKYIVAVHQPPYTKMQFIRSLAIILSLATAIANPVPSNQQGAASNTKNVTTNHAAAKTTTHAAAKTTTHAAAKTTLAANHAVKTTAHAATNRKTHSAKHNSHESKHNSHESKHKTDGSETNIGIEQFVVVNIN